MYQDNSKNHNVTVGIGLLLNTADDAKALPFFDRNTNNPTHLIHIENAFKVVKKAPFLKHASNYRSLTHIDISEADAVDHALRKMNEFVGLLKRSKAFSEFDNYPQIVKMGLLDMAYTLGAFGTYNGYPKFTAAVRRRDWNAAAFHSFRSEVSDDRNKAISKWFVEAAGHEKFFIDTNRRPTPLQILVK